MFQLELNIVGRLSRAALGVHARLRQFRNTFAVEAGVQAR
jgi:hypothetical protein